MTSKLTHLAGSLRHLPVRWASVALFALAITYADGFWVTVIQVTVGAIERNEAPLTRWLREATLMLPLVFLAVLVALLLARRWARFSRRALAGLLTTALLALFSGGVGIAEVAANSAYDYSFQTQPLELMHSYGEATQPGSLELAGFANRPSLPYSLYCNVRGVAATNAVVLMEYATLMLHVRTLGYATVLMLVTNLLIAAGLIGLRKEQVWTLLGQANLPIRR